MNDMVSAWLFELGRTTLFLTAAVGLTAVALRLTRASSPRVHRAAWCLVLLVGWLFVRLPIEIPWYAPTSGRKILRGDNPSLTIIDNTAENRLTPGEIIQQPVQETQYPAIDGETLDEGVIEINPGGPSERPMPGGRRLVAIDSAQIPDEPSPAALRREASEKLSSEASTPPTTILAHGAASTSKAVVVATPPNGRTTSARGGLSRRPWLAHFSWQFALAILWLLGMVAAVARGLAGYVRSIRAMSTALAPDEASRDQWRRLLAEQGIKRDIPLRLTPGMGPLLCRWPDGYELVVPAELWPSLGAAARESIMRHELAHYVRGDVWKSLAVRLLALPHWFNPAAWWAVRRFDSAAEWACDEAALAGGGRHTDFARTLLTLAEASLGGGSCHPAMSRWNLSARIHRLVNSSSPKDSIMKKLLLACLAAVLVTFCLVRVDLVAKTPAATPLVAEGGSPRAVAPTESNTPHEGSMISLPTYQVEPPDILDVELVAQVPKPPYQIGLHDVLRIHATGTLTDQPIDNDYLVEAEGTVSLGPAYGRVAVAGQTIEEAERAVAKKLRNVLAKTEVSLALTRSAGVQPVKGPYLIGPDGTINLRCYGSVHVAGKTLAEVKEQLEKHLVRWFDDPKIAVNVASYNSKVYYLIVRGTDQGDNVVRVPITGNETVLDAIAQLGGCQIRSTTKIHVSRPRSDCRRKEVILSVDFAAIVEGRDTTTNYQILPGDRVFVSEAKQFDALSRNVAVTEKTPHVWISGYYQGVPPADKSPRTSDAPALPGTMPTDLRQQFLAEQFKVYFDQLAQSQMKLRSLQAEQTVHEMALKRLEAA
ncbi:MAG: polysaccharide biosynthesis/export family protein, partial [Pirellulales bacterium]|nr:polysaccharide biosynthesis/export family protein [Pirellulales bacterium]